MNKLIKERVMILKNNLKREFDISFLSTNKFIIFCALIIGITLFELFFVSHEYKVAFILSMILFAINFLYLFLKKNKNLFEPLYLYSLYHITICLSIWYSIFTKFKTNVFFNNMVLRNNKSIVLIISIILYISAFVFIFLGYYSVKQEKYKKYKFFCEDETKISSLALNISIIVFASIGILNFIYNVYLFADGNFLLYFKNISLRGHEFKKMGTTLGYMFLETSVYIYLFKLIRENKNIVKSKSFIVLFTLSFLVKLSAGRIFQSLLGVLVIFSLLYYIDWNKKNKNNNKLFFVIGAFIGFFGILIFFLRIMSSISVNNQMTSDFFKTLISLVGKFGYYAFDTGNLANIAVMMKIVDSWSIEIGFLFGSSIFLAFFNFLPSGIKPTSYSVSVIVKEKWFKNVVGGNLPPTGVAEMYANFGFFGPTIGMFIMGSIIKKIYNFCIKKRNFWYTVAFLKVTIGFFMLYSNNEFDNFSVWQIAPILCSYLGLLVLTKIQYYLRKRSTRE